MEQVEKARGRLGEVAGLAEAGIAGERTETNPIFVGLGARGIDSKRLCRRIMAGQLSGRLDRTLGRGRRIDRDRAGPEQP